jgi:hypothetical protein
LTLRFRDALPSSVSRFQRLQLGKPATGESNIVDTCASRAFGMRNTAKDAAPITSQPKYSFPAECQAAVSSARVVGSVPMTPMDARSSTAHTSRSPRTTIAATGPPASLAWAQGRIALIRSGAYPWPQRARQSSTPSAVSGRHAARCPADKPNSVAHHHTLGPHHDRPQESSHPDQAPTATSSAQGRPSRRRAATKHRPRPWRRCPATAAGQRPLSDPGGSITEVDALRRPQLTSVANEEEHSPCDCIA